MRGLHYPPVDQSGARRNKGEKLTVQGKLIGTDTQILSVCVCVWYCCVSQDFSVSVKTKHRKKNLLSQKDSRCQTYQREPNDMEFFHHDLMFLENLMRRIFDFLLSEAGDQPQPGVRGNFAETFLSWQLLTFQPSG